MYEVDRRTVNRIVDKLVAKKILARASALLPPGMNIYSCKTIPLIIRPDLEDIPTKIKEYVCQLLSTRLPNGKYGPSSVLKEEVTNNKKPKLTPESPSPMQPCEEGVAFIDIDERKKLMASYAEFHSPDISE